MILTQILYSSGNERKSVVILLLGSKGNKIVCILDQYISRRDVDRIKQNLDRLKEFSLVNKLIWIKNNMSNTYRDGYRELLVKNVEIKRAFSLIQNKIIK